MAARFRNHRRHGGCGLRPEQRRERRDGDESPARRRPPPLALRALLHPRGLAARDVFAPLLDARCALLVSFIWRDGSRHFEHTVVGVGHSDAGLEVLDSGGLGGHGKTISFSYEAAPDGASIGDAPDDALPHGRVLRLPWVTMPFDRWRELGAAFRNGQSEPAPLGISREFLIVWPD